jgi:hypothetical protein
MKMHVKSVSSEYHERLRTALRSRARDLLRRYVPDGPPYDPYLVAQGLGVDVQDTEIAGIEGFIETKNGRYVASISTGANETRRRFTLAHELCHVLLMRTAEDGKPVDLIRFRANGDLPGLHQDPVEESLCNYFAGELLMPSDEIRKRLRGQNLVPSMILDFARDYDVSQQAAAIQIVRILKDRLIACSFWNLQSLWPMPLWWTGFRTQYQSELRSLEDLVERRSEVTEVWESYSGRRQQVAVMITPTPAKRYALILIARR